MTPVRITAPADVDLATVHVLHGGLHDAVHRERGPVVVDLSATQSLDSIGLAHLLNTLRRLTRQGRRMAVVCPNEAPRRLFEVTRLTADLGVVRSWDEAVLLVSG